MSAGDIQLRLVASIKPANAGEGYQLCQYNRLQNLGIGQA